MTDDGLSKIRNNPLSLAVYDALLTKLRDFADFEIENKKTSLHITHGRAFLGVHPRKDGILLNIVTTAPLSDKRIKKTERVSANRYHNELILSSPKELNATLVLWLREAYTLTE